MFYKVYIIMHFAHFIMGEIKLILLFFIVFISIKLLMFKYKVKVTSFLIFEY